MSLARQFTPVGLWSEGNTMSEQQNKGKTYVDWGNLKKTSVEIDRDGNQVTVERPVPGKPKSLEDFMKKRAQRMGR